MADKKGPHGPPIDHETMEKLRRGRVAMLKDAAKRRVAYKYWVGDQYWYVNAQNRLSMLDTTLIGGAKPAHRIRKTYNFLGTVIEAKVSGATQRVPGYEITPSTDDRMDQEAATTAAQVAAYLYDKVGVRRATTKVVTNALVQREGFAMPYFDPDVGPFTSQVDLQSGETVTKGRGEIRIKTFSRNEVGWEPGVDFEDSPWWYIEQAVPVEEVKRIPGYVGGEPSPDASTSDAPTDRDTDNMVLLTKFLERPTKGNPEGFCRYFANKREVCPPGPYPSVGPDGAVTSDPVLHRLSYTVNPEGDDQGLAERLIDPQNTINDCWNKLLEWKNRCLNPKRSAPIGSFRQGMVELGDVPGSTEYFNPVAGMRPEWEKPPAIPRELFDMLDLAVTQMRALAADVDVQPDPRLAAKTASQAVETAQLRWQQFLGSLAEFHSRMMRHMLTLAQVYYDDARTISIDGEYGYRTLENFKGQDLRSQQNVRVNPGSLESRSRQAIKEEVEMVATLWPGAVSPEAGIAAIHDGVGSKMIRSYENHVAKAWRIVKAAEGGWGELEKLPKWVDTSVDPMTGMTKIDPTTGLPPINPGWMPRKQENIDIWMQVLGDYMTTTAYDRLTMDIRQVFDLIWEALEEIKTQKMMAQVAERDAAAAMNGQEQAAKPQATPPAADRSQTNPK